MAYEVIQPVAFHLIEEGLKLPLKAMYFPDEWRPSLLNLASSARERGSERPASFPIWSLNTAIAAFTPQLFVTPGQVRDSSEPWLIATEEIPAAKIFRIIRAWLAEHYSLRDDLADDYDVAFNAMDEKDLVWQPFQLSISQQVLPNKTAQIKDSSFAALPAVVANTLVASGVRLQVGAHERGLVRVPASRGAELQTWPPVEMIEPGTGRKGAYSYRMSISLQTVVGCARPRIHVSYGVRRWRLDPLRTPDVLYLSGREGRTVYLRHPQALAGVPQSSHFTSAMIEGVFGSDGQRIPVWRDALAGIAGRIGAALPDPADLTIAPVRFLSPVQEDGVVAAIVEKTPRNHPVGAGLGLEVREALTTSIIGATNGVLSLIPQLTRSPVTTIQQRNQPMLADDLREIDANVRLQAIQDSIGPEMVVEIWYQKQACRDQLIESLHSMLTGERPGLIEPTMMQSPRTQVEQSSFAVYGEPGMPEARISLAGKKVKAKRAAPERPEIDFSTDHEILLPGGGRIRILPRQLPAWGAMLPEPSEADKKNRSSYKRRETQNRAGQIAAEVVATTIPTLALIEMPNFQNSRERQWRYQVGLRDPKRGVRLGLAQTGRVTKFTTGTFHADQEAQNAGRSDMTPEELLRKRCENAVLEGLRQMGYLPGSIAVTPPEGQSFPERMVVAGVRMLRLTSKRTVNTKIYLPVVTIFDTDKPGVSVWLPDDQVGMRSFYQGMLDITKFKDKDVSSLQQEKMLIRLQQFLTETLPEATVGDVVILAEAHNIRQLWPGLQNTEIEWDGLRFRRDSAATPIRQEELHRRFRLIRLRTSTQSETPIWYTPGAQPGVGYASGLFRDSEAPHTFYNIAVKPKTQGQARRGKQDAPREQYANPSMLEILVAAQQPEDNDEAWALAIHTWRRMGYLTGGDMTLLPIPLQWAEKMDRYAAVIGPWVFKNQDHLWVDEQIDNHEDEEDEGADQLSLFGDEEDGE